MKQNLKSPKLPNIKQKPRLEQNMSPKSFSTKIVELRTHHKTLEPTPTQKIVQKEDPNSIKNSPYGRAKSKAKPIIHNNNRKRKISSRIKHPNSKETSKEKEKKLSKKNKSNFEKLKKKLKRNSFILKKNNSVHFVSQDGRNDTEQLSKPQRSRRAHNPSLPKRKRNPNKSYSIKISKKRKNRGTLPKIDFKNFYDQSVEKELLKFLSIAKGKQNLSMEVGVGSRTVEDRKSLNRAELALKSPANQSFDIEPLDITLDQGVRPPFILSESGFGSKDGLLSTPKSKGFFMKSRGKRFLELEPMKKSQKSLVSDLQDQSPGSPVSCYLKKSQKINWFSNNPRMKKLKEELRMYNVIGVGSYAKVFRAFDKVLKIKVAVKMFDKRKAYDNHSRKQIQKELDFLVKLDHQNIVRLHRVVETSSNVGFVLEYWGLSTLKDLLSSTKPKDTVGSNDKNKGYLMGSEEAGGLDKCLNRQGLDPTDARGYIKQMIQGLIYMHSLGIYHRDIKPSNAMVYKGKVGIIDLGMAVESCGGEYEYTRCGTLSYLPPEMVQSKKYAPGKVDVWCLGASFYELLTGRCPYGGKELKEAVVKSNILSAEVDYRGIETRDQLVLRKMLCKNPNARISMFELSRGKYF